MARHVTGPGPRWQDLLLIYFQRQVVRIAKEGKAFTGKGIDTNRFALHAMRGEMGYRGVDIIHAKGQMTAARRLPDDWGGLAETGTRTTQLHTRR